MSDIPKQIIRLRGHHLVCLHFFRGEGYDHEYVENLRDVLQRAEAGTLIQVSSGTDDVCRTCPDLQGDICVYARDAEKGIREMDASALGLFHLVSGEEVLWVDLRKQLQRIFPEWTRRYCSCCDWRRACERTETFSGLTGH